MSLINRWMIQDEVSMLEDESEWGLIEALDRWRPALDHRSLLRNLSHFFKERQ
ncbi:hypothetical protein [Burkholderia gladioli]|uniref:hypothetical protein n=1 Tax=Burkholderia gladioli TaxID=28095 RepID=UPI001641CC7D|nr:hypothetical protein [Burkholderia gladioli]